MGGDPTMHFKACFSFYVFTISEFPNSRSSTLTTDYSRLNGNLEIWKKMKYGQGLLPCSDKTVKNRELSNVRTRCLVDGC